MYEIKQKKVEVNGIGFDSFERSITNACSFTVEVGTNGYKGGNAKKGSRTMLSIKGLKGGKRSCCFIRKRRQLLWRIHLLSKWRCGALWITPFS